MLNLNENITYTQDNIMIEHAIFAFTIVVCILNVFKAISVFCHTDLQMPFFSILSPTNALFSYPSFLYQAWYWSGGLF